MSECIFCRILAGDAPGTFVHRDDECAAFMDIQPVNVGHLLVIPIRHAASLAELDSETAGRIMKLGQRLGAALRASGLRCDGVNLLLADGETAGQEVFHAHLHVIPRFEGDGFGFRFGAHYGQRPPRETLDLAASQIRRAATGAQP
jgi:histidine triad (HIT) family protein